MSRQNQFTVDAESVQGIEGAEATFRCMKVRVFREWRDDPDSSNRSILEQQLVSWRGFVDDAGAELPQPNDEPGVIDELYAHEQQSLVLLLLAGPKGESAKN